MYLEAVHWIARVGAPWCGLRDEFHPWDSVYRRFARYQKRGVWHLVFAPLIKETDAEEVFADSSVIRVDQLAAGA